MRKLSLLNIDHRTVLRDFCLVLRAGVVSMLLGVLVGHGCMAADTPASSMPNRPVRILVGFAPGGTGDIITRVMAEQLSEIWKQPVVIENRPGASGSIGVDMVARAAKDGYTLAQISATHTVIASTMPKLPYDLARDFSPINRSVDVAYILVAGSSPTMTSAATIADLITTARNKPKLVSYATSGPGTLGHLATELFAQAAKIDMLHVPYKGSALAFPDLMSGRVDFTLASTPEIIGPIRNRQFRAVAVTSAKRLAILPDVPALAEAVKGYEAVSWFGFVAPASIPRAVQEKLNADFSRAAMTAKARATWEDMGVVGTSASVAQFDAHIKSELSRWGNIVKALGLSPN